MLGLGDSRLWMVAVVLLLVLVLVLIVMLILILILRLVFLVQETLALVVEEEGPGFEDVPAEHAAGSGSLLEVPHLALSGQPHPLYAASRSLAARSHA